MCSINAWSIKVIMVKEEEERESTRTKHCSFSRRVKVKESP
jgi:hypothetical protein